MALSSVAVDSPPYSAPTLADVFAARRRLAPHLRPTPVLEPEALAEALGFRVFLKCEHLNPTGAFKVRGGVNLLASMSHDERARGVIAASTGNHAQSVAFAARLFDVPALIYMPEAANSLKVANTRALGAEVVLEGPDFDAARERAEARAEAEGLRYIQPIEAGLISGVATAALELLEAVPDLDVIFVPIGGGSGVLGAGVVARAVNPAIRVIGVQSEGAPAVYQSWRGGRRVVTDSVQTFAEGLATREPFALTLALLPRLVDELMLVSDAALVSAIRLLIETSRQVAEGAGAAGIAGAVARRRELRGKNVGIVLSGGNITAEQLQRMLSRDPDPNIAEFAR